MTDDVRIAIEQAYGLLWLDNPGSRESHAARAILLPLLDQAGKKRGVQYATARFGPADPPLTDVHRSVRDGTFGVQSASPPESEENG